MAHRLKRSLVFSTLFLAIVPAMAQMADPTRPPAGVTEVPSSVEAIGPVLQSVVIPKKGRPVAVIGGQQVRLGEMYGESRLIKLSEREAVLKSDAGIERLMLTPGVEKTNIMLKTATKASAANRAQRGGKQ